MVSPLDELNWRVNSSSSSDNRTVPKLHYTMQWFSLDWFTPELLMINDYHSMTLRNEK